ncbi:histidine kinase [Anditalea andensis]|uniref:Oxygen sensor histidine kinase NreB n=1 Tax=Anditalea andensis TaxID=1048983 RepID=A0A074KQT9_9BACT|nr:histidine kinase [Anditalea andensis]
MEKSDFGAKKFERLGLRYILALSAIATTIIISQIILQFNISQQEDDSIEVNLSGRQRMLSQRISKAAVLIGKLQPDERAPYLAELKLSLLEWEQAHAGLQNGDPTLGVSGNNSPLVSSMFKEIAPYFSEIVLGSRSLISIAEAEDTTEEALVLAIDRILAHESQFLAGMDRIVFQYDKEAQIKINRLRRIEIGLLAFALFLIFLEVRFIFIPSAKMVKKNTQYLQNEEIKAKKMALEISALYESLEQSFQNLAEIEIELGEFTVFAKCSPNGTFHYFSDKFMEIMAFGKDSPVNIFDWLGGQGYESTFLGQIHMNVQKGQTWKGDLKLTNNEGDFVWIKLHLIPILDVNRQVHELMLVSVDESEIMEAQYRSQELHEERMEKKLKEQQFRSALILEGQEEERRRISRDMHDGIGQYLTALKYNLEGISAVKAKSEKDRLENAKKLLQDIIKEVRRISFNLTPVALSDYGIVSVLKKFGEEMSKISKIPVYFENITGFHARLEAKIENNLYRIVQEAVNNAIKYSEAKEIKILLSHNDQFLHLEIRDDGVGFDYEALDRQGYFTATGHGIFNIKERVNFIQGVVQVDTAPGQGTAIKIDLPLDT